jgi:acetyl esterase/lipase
VIDKSFNPKTYLAVFSILVCVSAGGCVHHRHHISNQHPVETILAAEHLAEYHNLKYASPNKSMEQTLDLYIPLSVKPPYPVLIWVHGGSWMYGDKNPCFACNKYFASYAIASVNYRLSSESAFPCQIYDLKAAVRFLRANAGRYKLDKNRFGIWGSSAGGHLAALLGTSGGVAELEGKEGNADQSSKVQAVCDWSGPTDFNTADAQAAPGNKIRFSGQSSPLYVFMGEKMDKESLAKASPVTYVSKDSPPFLIMHGDEDDAIPPAQSQELCDLLKSKGVDATYELVRGYGHFFGAPEHFERVKNFFDSKLGVKP